MIRLISAELFKLRKRSMTRILLWVLLGMTVLFYLLLFAIVQANVSLPNPSAAENMQNALGLPNAVPFALNVLSSFGTVLAIILAASAIGSEYNWRTIRVMLTSSESRFKLLSAKLISVVILILIGMVVGLFGGFIMSLITTAIGGYAFDFSFATDEYLWDQFLQFWRTFSVLAPYMLLGFLFAIAGRSVMPGIALGIGILFLEGFFTFFMILAGGWIARIPDYLLSVNVDAITALNDLPQGFGGGPMGGGFSSQAPEISHAFIVLAGYSLVFIVLAFYLFRKRDVTG